MLTLKKKYWWTKCKHFFTFCICVSFSTVMYRFYLSRSEYQVTLNTLTDHLFKYSFPRSPWCRFTYLIHVNSLSSFYSASTTTQKRSFGVAAWLTRPSRRFRRWPEKEEQDQKTKQTSFPLGTDSTHFTLRSNPSFLTSSEMRFGEEHLPRFSVTLTKWTAIWFLDGRVFFLFTGRRKRRRNKREGRRRKQSKQEDWRN